MFAFHTHFPPHLVLFLVYPGRHFIECIEIFALLFIAAWYSFVFIKLVP